MEKTDYLEAIKIPFFLFIIHNSLTYAQFFFLYRDVTKIEQILTSFPLTILIFSMLLTIFSSAIIFYAGWTAISKFNGTIKNSMFMGLIAGGLQIILSTITTIITYTTISSYKIELSSVAGLGNVELVLFFLGSLLIGIPITLIIDVIIAALGGFISRKVNKKDLNSYEV